MIRKSYRHSRGTSLVEAIIFIGLLSVLMTSCIAYAVSIHRQASALFDDINASYTGTRGFIATTAVVVISMGLVAFLVSVASASFWYADSVTAREVRIQHELNYDACLDTLTLSAAKKLGAQGRSVEITSETCASLGFPL